MQDYYRDEYGAESTYIPYSGAVGDDPDAGALARFGIQPGNYYLVVARMEPENNVDLIIREYRASGLGRPLIVVGSVPYDSDYARAVAAQDDGQVRCVGGVFESAALNALYRHCAAYLHGHEVGGTNPGLLRAMHWGAPCLPVNVAFHRETMGEDNPRFDTTPGHLAARAALRAFAARLETDRPDIVHAHELYPLITPWLFELCARAGVPIVHSCYDFRITCAVATHYDGQAPCTRCTDGAHHALLRNCRNDRFESAAFALRHAIAQRRDFYRRHVTRFIVLTDFSRDWLASHAGIDPARISVNECAIPLDPGPVDPASSRFLAFAGRFVREKGLDILLEAARIAGPAGSDPATLRARGVPPNLPVTITCGPEALAQVYRGARALVVPSLWFETFAIVAAEAMAHGVPVIASRMGALRDTFREEQTGLHFAPGDPVDLARQMRRIWDDPALCRALGRAAHADVAARFSEDAHCARLLAAYELALAGPRHRHMRRPPSMA